MHQCRVELESTDHANKARVPVYMHAGHLLLSHATR